MQIFGALGISNRCKKIKNWGRYFKSRQRYFELDQRLQIRAREIKNRERDFKLGQGLFFAPICNPCAELKSLLSYKLGKDLQIGADHY